MWTQHWSVIFTFIRTSHPLQICEITNYGLRGCWPQQLLQYPPPIIIDVVTCALLIHVSLPHQISVSSMLTARFLWLNMFTRPRSDLRLKKAGPDWQLLLSIGSLIFNGLFYTAPSCNAVNVIFHFLPSISVGWIEHGKGFFSCSCGWIIFAQATEKENRCWWICRSIQL